MNKIVKNTTSNQQKLLLINSLESPSFKEWQTMQRKVFHVSSQEQVNFKTKLKNYELPSYKYGKKSFGKKLLSRQRLKNIYKLSDSNLKNILARVNKTSSGDLMWELVKKECSSKNTMNLFFSSNKNLLKEKLTVSKSLSLYGMAFYLKKLSHNLIYLNSWNLRNSNKTLYSKEYINLLFLMRKLENALFLKTCTPYKMSLDGKDIKNSQSNIVQTNSTDDTLIWIFYHLSGIDKGLKSVLENFNNISELNLKSPKDLEYFKLLMKNKIFSESEIIHKDLLQYTRILRSLISLNYDPEYNWFSKSSPHLIRDFSNMNLVADKTRLKLSADQEQVCEDLVSFTNTR